MTWDPGQPAPAPLVMAQKLLLQHWEWLAVPLSRSREARKRSQAEHDGREAHEAKRRRTTVVANQVESEYEAWLSAVHDVRQIRESELAPDAIRQRNQEIDQRIGKMIAQVMSRDVQFLCPPQPVTARLSKTERSEWFGGRFASELLRRSLEEKQAFKGPLTEEKEKKVGILFIVPSLSCTRDTFLKTCGSVLDDACLDADNLILVLPPDNDSAHMPALLLQHEALVHVLKMPIGGTHPKGATPPMKYVVKRKPIVWPSQTAGDEGDDAPHTMTYVGLPAAPVVPAEAQDDDEETSCKKRRVRTVQGTLPGGAWEKSSLWTCKTIMAEVAQPEAVLLLDD